MTVKRILAATLLVLGVLLWTAASIGGGAQRRARNPDNGVSTSPQLLENARTRTALAVAMVDRLYDTSAVEQRLRETLPPRLDRLAAPAAAGLKEVALRNAPRVLGTAAALKSWKAANRQAHGVFVDLVEGRIAAGGDVTLNVQDLLRQLAVGSGLPAGAADKLPPRVAQFQLLQSDEVATAQDAVSLFRDLVWVLLALAV